MEPGTEHQAEQETGQKVGVELLDPVTRSHVERAAEALQREFEGVFSQETIARYIAESSDLLGGKATVNVFVPVLVHRFARERLKALGQAEGVIVKEQPKSCSSACTTLAAVRWLLVS